MVSLVQVPDDVCRLPHSHGFFDDFNSLDATRWTDTATQAALDADGVGGVYALTTTATDNAGVYGASLENFKYAANKPIVFTARFQYAEANTDDANIFIGVADAADADLMLNDGAGPKTSFSGFGIYKVDGGTRYQVISSNGSTQTKTDTELSAGGSGYVSVKIEVLPISSTEAEVTFWFDANGGNDFSQIREYNVNPRVPAIKHTVTMTSATEMAVALNAKPGDTNAEVLNIDYVSCYQAR